MTRMMCTGQERAAEPRHNSCRQVRQGNLEATARFVGVVNSNFVAKAEATTPFLSGKFGSLTVALIAIKVALRILEQTSSGFGRSSFVFVSLPVCHRRFSDEVPGYCNRIVGRHCRRGWNCGGPPAAREVNVTVPASCSPFLKDRYGTYPHRRLLKLVGFAGEVEAATSH